MRRLTLWLLVLLAAPGLLAAADVVVFVAHTYTRSTATPVAVTETFRIQSPAGRYTLRLTNQGVTSGDVSLNGTPVFGPDDFTVEQGTPGAEQATAPEPGDDRVWADRGRDNRQAIGTLSHEVTLKAGANVLVVDLRSQPGTSVVIDIVNERGDATVPTLVSSPAMPAPGSAPAAVTSAPDGGARSVSAPAPALSASGAVTSAAAIPVPSGSPTPSPTSGAVPGPAPNGAARAESTVSAVAEAGSQPSAAVSTPPSPTATGGVAGSLAPASASPTPGPAAPATPVVSAPQAPEANAAANARAVAVPPTLADLNADRASSLPAPPPVGATSVSPGDIAVNAVTPVLFTAQVDDPAVIAGGVNLIRVDGNGRALTVMGVMQDDGANGDAVAGDKVFSAQVALTGDRTTGRTVSQREPGATLSVGPAYYRASVAYRGVLLRAMSNQMVVTVHDVPAITAAVSPPPNASGWNRSAATVHFTCTSTLGIATCPPDQVVSQAGAGQVVIGTATDVAGFSARASATVNLDFEGPALTWTAPAADSTVFAATTTATATITDGLSGVASATCNGVPAQVAGTALTCLVALARGANTITATVTDVAGNAVDVSPLAVTSTRLPTVTLTAPAGASYLNISPTTVSGTVDDPAATVTVNAIPATVANGAFSLALPIAEGPNIISASATSADGGTGTASVEVTLDTTPPHVTITTPADGFTTTAGSVSIAGNVNDLVVGTVNDQQAQVTVNGTAATVANRTFLATDVPLALGLNQIQAVARDRVGNQATTVVTVVRQAPLPQPEIRVVSGNGQTGVIGTEVAAPLVVELLDAVGVAMPGRTVIFRVTQNDGLLAAGGEAAVTVLTTTDAGGRAQARWTLGHRAGAGGNVVEAYSVGSEGTAIFNASGTQGTAGRIVVDTGNDQIGPIGQALPRPFIAVVVDAGNNRLGGVPVTFTVQQGGGSFEGQPTLLTTSDSDGRVAAVLTLGEQEGSANNLVEATFAGNTGAPAAFAASGRAPGDPAETTVTGVVLDNSNVPIPGVTVRAALTTAVRSSLQAVAVATAVRTDAHGQFTIAQAPVGLIKLLIDGTTAEREGTYPSLEYDFVTVAGQQNDVGQPIYLLALSTANQLCVTDTTGGGTLTVPEAPGFSLTFGPGQVTFPGGSKSGCVSVTVVNADKVPMVPGFGQQPRFIVTIQPAGAVFNPPAPITIPNVDGLLPRAVTEMYSFDHDIGSFVAIGTGIVSDDGQVIRSAPGVGVLKAGWHCGGDPAANGTVADCPVCQSCQGNACVPDDTNKPPERCASCNAGNPVPPKSDATCCAEARAANPAATTDGYVVCCNGTQTACVTAGGSFPAGDAGQNIIRACVFVHERAHYTDIICPAGAAECTTTQPNFKPGRSAADGECDATKAELVCLRAADCTTVTNNAADLATCRAKVTAGILDAKNYANNAKPGCVP